jgi:hypothetical protein
MHFIRPEAIYNKSYCISIFKEHTYIFSKIKLWVIKVSLKTDIWPLVADN